MSNQNVDPSESPDEREIREITEQRKERAAASKKSETSQRVIDLRAINELEIELGESGMVELLLPFAPGRVTAVVAQIPNTAQIKRYRFMVRQASQGMKAGEIPDLTEAAELLADATLRYPEKEAFAKACVELPGLKAQLGHKAAELVVGESKK